MSDTPSTDGTPTTTPLAATGDPADAKAAFGRLMAEWNAAIVTNDADAIGAFAAPDWVFVGENGLFTGAAFLESVAAGRISHDSMTAEVHEVRLLGDVAVVIARVRNSGVFMGEPFTLDEWSTDVFVRDGGRWLCTLTHLTSVAAGPESADRS